MCDFNSVDVQNDVSFNDCLHYNHVGENQLLHASKDHKWYYLSDQKETELLVFRNTDSKGIRACKRCSCPTYTRR